MNAETITCPKCGHPANVGPHSAGNCPNCFLSFRADRVPAERERIEQSEPLSRTFDAYIAGGDGAKPFETPRPMSRADALEYAGVELYGVANVHAVYPRPPSAVERARHADETIAAEMETPAMANAIERVEAMDPEPASIEYLAGARLKHIDGSEATVSETATSDQYVIVVETDSGFSERWPRDEIAGFGVIAASPQTRAIGRSAAEKFANASDEIDIPETAHHHPDYIPPAASGEHYARTGSGELIGPYGSAEEAERERIASETESERAKVLALAVELSSDGAELFEGIDGPGKFDGAGDRKLAAAMLEIAGHGAEDERAGDVESTGAAWRVGRFIAVEDSQGFVSVDAFDSSEIATAELEKFDPPSEDDESSEDEPAEPATGIRRSEPHAFASGIPGDPRNTSPEPRYIVRGTDHAAEEADTISRPEVFDTKTGQSVGDPWSLNDWDRAERFAAELNEIETEPAPCAGTGDHSGQSVDSCDECSPEPESDESGAVTRIGTDDDGSVSIYANGAALRAWAHEPGNSWPCSELAKLRSVYIKLAPNGDLVELGCDPEYKAGGERSEPSADELSAWQDAALKGFPPIERTIRRTLTRDLPNGSRIVANVELRKDGDRGLSGGFSVTGELYEKHGTWTGAAQQRNGREADAGGCIHDELSKAFPKLRPLIALHLSAEDGTPMHAEANARYWHEQSAGMIPISNTYGREKDRDETQAAYCRRLACETLRIEALPADLDRFAERVLLTDGIAAKENLGAAGAESTERERKAYREAFAAFIDAQRGRWAREAIIGRHAIESMPEA